MKVRDIMTRKVHTVSPETPVKEVARILADQRVSGVPVVDAQQRVVGIISESDFLHRRETGTERRQSWWLEFIGDSRTLAREYAKSHGVRAEEVMTAPAVTVTSDSDLSKVADLFDSKRIKRAPVVDGGKLVGIISRGDFVRLLAARLNADVGAPQGDAAIRAALDKAFRAHSWSDSALLSFDVKNGEVELRGLIADEDQRNAVRVVAENVPGVRKITDQMRIGQLPAAAL